MFTRFSSISVQGVIFPHFNGCGRKDTCNKVPHFVPPVFNFCCVLMAIQPRSLRRDNPPQVRLENAVCHSQSSVAHSGAYSQGGSARTSAVAYATGVPCLCPLPSRHNIRRGIC